MKKKICVSLLLLVVIVAIGTMVMADDYLIGLYRDALNGIMFNMIWVGVVIVVSIAGIVTLNILKKKERIKPVVYKVLMVILVIVLIALVCYEGKLIWDYTGLRPAYDYWIKNESIG